MAALLKSWAPNVWAYRVKFLASAEATAQMFLIAGAFTLLCGFFFGILLTVTRKGGIRPNAALFCVVDAFINIFRSIPFVILLIFLIPFTRALVGTAIGVKGAVVPLIFSRPSTTTSPTAPARPSSKSASAALPTVSGTPCRRSSTRTARRSSSN